jgi:hypothetical protein
VTIIFEENLRAGGVLPSGQIQGDIDAFGSLLILKFFIRPAAHFVFPSSTHSMASKPSKITCYSYQGAKYDNNTKCPDSDSCCQTEPQCRPDRLCSSNDNSQVLVRATCVNEPWTLSTCAKICLYGALRPVPLVDLMSCKLHLMVH